MAWCPVGTPLGTFILEADGNELVACHLPGRHAPPETAPVPDHPVLFAAGNQLVEWATGQRRDFDLPLAPVGTDFQRAVWQALQEIPYGSTRTYAEVASMIGKPGAARAIGQANNRNPLAPFIPCHRVVAANGLGGYGGGEALKQTMLALEASHKLN